MSDFETKRDNYAYFTTISTRWTDNDTYGHINNATYYNFFDTVANEYLMRKGNWDPQIADVIGFIVASSCQYDSPLAHPAEIVAGFRVNRLGNSSVEYGVAIFEGPNVTAAAYGTFTHVFVDRRTSRAVPIPDEIRHALSAVAVSQGL